MIRPSEPKPPVRLEPTPAPAPIRSATPTVLPSKPVIFPSFHGRITEARGGAPVAGALIHLVETRDEVQSDGLGRFVLPALQPGARTVHVSKPGYRSAQRRVRPQLGLGPMGLDFALETVETGRIEGRVSFRGPVPESFTVYLDLRPHRFDSPDGTFTIEPVNGGRRKIAYGIPQGPDAKPLPLYYQPIEIEPGETTRVELEAPPLGHIAGVVVGPDGAPIRGGFLRFHPLYVPIGLDGTFDSRLVVAGVHPVRLVHPDFGQPLLGRLELGEGEERTNLRYTVKPAGDASVLVTFNPAGLPRGLFSKRPQVFLWDMSRATVSGAESQALLTSDRRSVVFHPRTGHRFLNVAAGPHRVAIMGPTGTLQRDIVVKAGETVRVELGARDKIIISDKLAPSPPDPAGPADAGEDNDSGAATAPDEPSQDEPNGQD